MIEESVAFLVAQGKRVLFDAEHFFDGYALDSVYAFDCLRAATDAGAERVVLCDTNGGTLPSLVGAIVEEARASSTRRRSSGFTPTTTPVAQSRTRWSRSRRGPPRSRARSTASASAPATPTW